MQGSGRSLLYGILFPIILYRFRIIFNNKKFYSMNGWQN